MHLWCFREVGKVRATHADTHTMMISDEQGMLAACYLATPCPLPGHRAMCAVSSDLIAQAQTIAENTPETRDDRMLEARAYLASGNVDARKVAAKMISRILCDSIR